MYLFYLKQLKNVYTLKSYKLIFFTQSVYTLFFHLVYVLVMFFGCVKWRTSISGQIISTKGYKKYTF